MTIIYIIIGCALASILLKLVKALDNSTEKNKNNNNNSRITVKDGMNLYFGKIIGKLIILGIGIIIILLMPIIISFIIK